MHMHAIKRACLVAGVPQGERPPLEKNPQTLLYRTCPRREGFPLGRVSGQTRAQLTRRHRLGFFYGLNLQSYKYIKLERERERERSPRRPRLGK